MVFTYWRDQYTDVLGNYSSFEEHHLQECDEDAFDTKALTLI